MTEVCDLLAQRAVYMEGKRSYGTMKILDDGTTFRWVTCKNSGPCGAQVEKKKLKMTGDKNKTAILGTPALLALTTRLSPELSQ